MDEGGLWRLFLSTGLPEAWLALSVQRRTERTRRGEEDRPAGTALPPGKEKV